MLAKITITLFFLFATNVFLTSQTISTVKHTSKDTTYLDFVNNMYSPIEFIMSVKPTYEDSIGVQDTLVIPAHDTARHVIWYLSSLPKDSTIPLRTFINIIGNFGHPASVEADKNFPYVLPFRKSYASRIIQPFGGSFSHNLPSSYYAIDFDMNIGDTVTAARAGTVVYVKQDSKEHGKTRAFSGKANKVIVMHSDGTYGHYLHLKFNGALVVEGMQVEAGQPIGLVGMSGFTTVPHLHFVLHKERGIAIPFQFQGVKHKVLKKGKKYKRK